MPIELNGCTFYEPKLRWKRGRAYARFYDPDKQPTQKDFALYTSDSTAAGLLFQRRRLEYLHGTLDPWEEKRREGVTLEEAIRLYLKAQDVRPSSLKAKGVRLMPFARKHPGMLVSGITASAVRAYCYRDSLKPSTQQRYLHEMRQFLDFCQSKGWTAKNAAHEVHRSTPRRKRRDARKLVEYLTPQELRSILDAIERDIAEKPLRAGRRVLVDVITFAVLTGLRLGEIARLRWSDVSLYEPPRPTKDGGLLYGWISVRSEAGALTKTGDSDRVPVVPQAYELLRRLRAHPLESKNATVFGSPRGGGSLHGWWVSSCFRHYRRAVGLRNEIHFHSLRHTCASWLAEAGVDLKVIQEVLRHSNIRQTMRYAHLIPEAVASKMIGAFEGISLD